MHEVFISYSSKDKIIADAICHALEENKIPCWIAPRDVQPGIPYAREIIKGIKECKVMVLVFTANSNTSEHVCNEIDKAFNNKKIIVPFLVENIAMDEALEYYLSRKHWLTAYPYYEKHLDELVVAVGKVLGRNIVIENKAKKPEQKDGNLPASSNAVNANLKILADVDCKVFVDCEEKGFAVAGSLLKMPLPPGEYYIEFVSTANEQDRITEEITIERDTLYKVNLNAVQKKREEERSDNLKLVPYIQNKKVGFIDEETMQIVIPCKYNDSHPFYEGLAGVVQLNGKYGFIDKTGREIIPCKYDYARHFYEGLACVQLNRKYGFIDKTGREIIPCKYYDASNFYEGLACVQLNGKYGFIDKTGREIIPCKYKNAFSFNEGLASVKINDRWGFIDKTGSEVIPCKYNYARPFSEGLASVKINDRWGFIDKTGSEVIPCKYKFADSFSEGLASVVLNGEHGFIDKNGSEIIPSKYYDASNFNEGLACVKINDRRGFIDKTGREIIPCKYDDAGPFNEGLACVKINNRWGLIDKTGREIIPCKYDYAHHFSEGLVSVELNGKYGHIDKFGNCTLD